MKQAQTRIAELRRLMLEQGIDVYIMENNDPHESEYLPDHWKEVEWLSGFRGEVAIVVVTQSEALLWTDSRFFISGEQQLADTPFKIIKMKVSGYPTVEEWLSSYRGQYPNTVTGGDLRILFANEVDRNINLIEKLWLDRPALPQSQIEIYPVEYSGEETATRIDRVLQNVEAQGAKGLWIPTLDEIAWVLNLRGDDIACTPVFIAYLWLARQGSVLYVDDVKLSDEVRQYLSDLGIGVMPYEEAAGVLQTYGEISGKSPIPLMRAVKNAVEIAGFRSAMKKDGVALTRFYHWLEDALSAGETVTEMDCSRRLISFRQEQKLYRQESFPAIVAWNEHGSMPHYEPSDEQPTDIKGDGLLLIDTGGQYLDGTTDITRTIGIGQVSKEMKRDYTLVLKGHIRLARAVFPRGTRGDQLDALARMDLWRDGKTYRHGTSHGVGHYLGVHEGPESVRMEHNPQVLLDGMFFSNEPAIYLGGKYGIRHENCVLVRPFDVENEAPDATPCLQEEHGEFLCLDTLTICYLDTTCVLPELLDVTEKNWLNEYNRWCFEVLSPDLNESDRLWLAQKCKPLC